MIYIKKIQFKNHYLFGNQEFNFMNGSVAYKNIVFAGENGTGKTTILNIINEYLKASYRSSRITNYDLADTFITLDISDLNYLYGSTEKINEIILSKYKDSRGYYNYNMEFPQFRDQYHLFSVGKITKKDLSIGFPIELDSLYSRVEINYNSRNNVDSFYENDVDTVNLLSSNDIAHDVIKLLCTISRLDDADFHKYYEDNNVIMDKSLLRETRINNAISHTFGNSLKYNGIKKGHTFVPTFLADNKEVEIKYLSSGQKQIVFRGASLLHNIHSNSGFPVLIDEPELSMHPIWERKIYDFYKNLFTIDDNQTSQIFYATHSEHLLNDAMKDESCLIVKLNNKEHVDISNNNSILPTLTLGEIKYSIFNLYTVDFHNLLYAYIGNKLVNSSKIKNIDSYFGSCNECPLKPYHATDSDGKTHDSRTLPTYVRNCIDHPDEHIIYKEADLEQSTEYMIKIIKEKCKKC